MLTKTTDETYAAACRGSRSRVTTDGKFLTLQGEIFRVRGATYGSFRRRESGDLYPAPEIVRADLESMAANGLNTVRTYTLPPADLLDTAAELGLRVVVGLHYHDWRMEHEPGRRARRRILDAGRAAVYGALERCAGRANVLAVAVGNEVPGDLVRAHGRSAVEQTLAELIADLHAGDPDLLATYVNFPTTEYLDVPGQDLISFNVFLEQPEALRRYLRRLQIVAGDRPLLISELGLPAGVHGDEAQADALAWELQLVEEAGCVGATVFSWTDEWYVDGEPVEGWGFGLTDAARQPKAALDIVRLWAHSTPRTLRSHWPRVSVVVCARNEEPHIADCLGSLARSEYPDLEVVFCDDGSTDATVEVARQFDCRILELEHGGLSQARNAGIAAATGDVVAFLDADAECHPDWPFHLVLSLDDGVAGTGGPNTPPADSPFIERVVAAAPGAPVEVLVADDRAEHVPGCNMAFRREALIEIGGFDPVYTSAGDDVDVCWKILDAGYDIGFAAAAQVRHHRPESIGRYLRQQRSYGRAERMLYGRHPHRFNRVGQARWRGSIYGGPRVLPSLLRPVVYHGPMGFAPFQRVSAKRGEHALAHASLLLPLTVPVAALGALAVLSLWWLAAPAAAFALLAAFMLAIASAVEPGRHERRRRRFKLLVAVLHVAQPMWRTWGRLRGQPAGRAADDGAQHSWTGDRGDWLRALLHELARTHARVEPGGAHDPWDLAVSVGPFLKARVTTAVAWSWTPVQRTDVRPRPALYAFMLAAGFLGLFAPAAAAAFGGVLVAAVGIEGLWLRRLLARVIGATTAGRT